MHSPAAFTIREWQRHELLADAEREILLKQIPTPTQRQKLARRLQALMLRVGKRPQAFPRLDGGLLSSET